MAEREEIVQVSKNEFRIKNNKIFLLKDNILYIEAYGEQTDEIAAAHLEHYKQVLPQIRGKLSYLIDLNHTGKNSTEARKVWQQLSEFDSTYKVALYGMHPVARILASFVTGVTNKKDIRFFNTKEEALTWLKT